MRTLFLSDVHLGTRDCQADLLLSFLEHHDCERLYLVGDIVDLWSMKRSAYWNASQGKVVDHLLRASQRGTTVTYVCGNHDERLREYVGMLLGSIRVCNERVHRTASGRRLLVLHGDQFDGELRCGKWRDVLGDCAYLAILRVNHLLNTLRRRIGFRYWSLANALKRSLPQAARYIARFEALALEEARRRTYDGVVCGHIHKAELEEREGLLYANCGDWVESCTALAETMSGQLELIRWTGPPATPRRVEKPSATPSLVPAS